MYEYMYEYMYLTGKARRMGHNKQTSPRQAAPLFKYSIMGIREREGIR